MEIFKKDFFNIDYHPKLIDNFIKLSPIGIYFTGLIAPIIMYFTINSFIPTLYLGFTMISLFAIFIVRIVFIKKLSLAIKINVNIKKYLLIQLLSIFVNALLYTSIIFLCIVFDVPNINTLIIAFIIFSLAAASFPILSNVFIMYFIFMVTMLVPLIIISLYYGGVEFNTFAMLMFLFLFSQIISGYKQFVLLKNAVSLEDTFSTIYNKSTDGIALIKNYRFFDCNEAIVKMFKNSSKDDFLSKHIGKFSPKLQPDGRISIRKMLSKLKEGSEDKAPKFDWLHHDKNGKAFWTEIILTKIIIDGEDVIHGIWRDISDRKNLEEKFQNLNETLESQVKKEVKKNREKDRQLLQQSKLAQMGEMISMIAHQWRQPLTAISATSGNISIKLQLGKTIEDEFLQTEMNKISDFSQHLSSTIDDFRDFFKEDKEKKITSMRNLIESTLSITQTSLENKGIKVVTADVCDKEIETYPSEIKQVLLNLIKNAEDVLLEKKIENPTITIDTICEDETIIIKDNGGGIPKEIIEHIFDPYFSTKKEKDGTGLGLYMSKTIIEKHCGGKLHVDNDEDGAVFRITF